MNAKSFSLERVWQSIDASLSKDIVDFWLINGALKNREAAMQRVGQVAYIARASSGEIVAVTSAYLKENTQLNGSFYYLRAFVAEPARRSSVGIELLRKVQTYFESLYKEGMLSPAIGLFLEVENPLIKKSLNEAIWPDTNFVYIGSNTKGDHLRVYYFDGARIS